MNPYAYDFVSHGIACHALVILERLGILDTLKETGSFEEAQLSNKKKFKNLIAVKTALLAVCSSGILSKKNNTYFLTDAGHQLANNIGLVTMLFEGYGKLLSKGLPIALGKKVNTAKYLDDESIAVSSIKFGEKTVDPIAIEAARKLKPMGTICDLGCGSADRLIKICEATHLPGLGLDASPKTVEMARALTKDHVSIRIERADVTNLEGVWKDVEILMQSFMTHDIAPRKKYVDILHSYQTNFPNLKYFIIIDIVAPEEDALSYMPGYDYVHGLLGIETPRYRETISRFLDAGYKIVEEVPIDMPNTYLWILKPNSVARKT